LPRRATFLVRTFAWSLARPWCLMRLHDSHRRRTAPSSPPSASPALHLSNLPEQPDCILSGRLPLQISVATLGCFSLCHPVGFFPYAVTVLVCCTL
jgi:hypothetical protein